MAKEKREQLAQKLEKLWGELTELQSSEDDRQTKINDIFSTICDMYPGNNAAMEAISDFFCSDWPKFDPALGKLSAFVESRIALRMRDVYKRNTGGQYKTVEDPNTRKIERKFVPLISLDAPSGEDDAPAGRDTLAARSETDPYARITLDDTACQLLLLMMELPQRLEGRANNPTRRNYFRLFFTDGVATALQSGPVPEVFRRRENDLFHALKVPFLDYFMAERCRTVDDIAAGSTKPYGQVVEGQGPEPTPLPLRNDVFITYLDREEGYSAKAPAVSQQRQQYQQFMRDNLER